MMIKEYITNSSRHTFDITWSGLAAIFVTARCKSAKQLSRNIDENLRVVINGLNFRELPPEKNIQLFDVPASFNGNKLKGLKQTIVFITVLSKGTQTVDLISRGGAHLEDIRIERISSTPTSVLNLENQAEDGDRRPWLTFVLVDVPLKSFHGDFTITRRFIDSDDVKIVINGKTEKQLGGGFYKFWFLAGGLLDRLFGQAEKSSRKNIDITTSFDSGIHYLELSADRMPILHSITFDLNYPQTNAEKRAEELVKFYSKYIQNSAEEFNVNPIIVGGVIYQEQSTNVNFIDTLGDYLGGIFGLDTSIGVGQVRISTAEKLEGVYPTLHQNKTDSVFVNDRFVRIERLKDPFINIRYVAAKIKFSQDRWAEGGCSLANRPDILGTLYNIESIDQPITPKENPQSNSFGAGVGRNYEKVKHLLGL